MSLIVILNKNMQAMNKWMKMKECNSVKLILRIIQLKNQKSQKKLNNKLLIRHHDYKEEDLLNKILIIWIMRI